MDRISFEVRRGEVVGLLGPNGAGKTTTLNMVLGVLEPTGGTIRIEGVDLARARTQALERTNFAAVYAPLPGNLTVAQNLRVFGLLYGVANLGAKIATLLAQFELERFARDQVRRALLGRADAGRAREGDAQRSAAAAPRRADRLARSGERDAISAGASAPWC